MPTLVLVMLLLAGCGFRNCLEISAPGDNQQAALCEATCRCVPAEGTAPFPPAKKD